MVYNNSTAHLVMPDVLSAIIQDYARPVGPPKKHRAMMRSVCAQFSYLHRAVVDDVTYMDEEEAELTAELLGAVYYDEELYYALEGTDMASDILACRLEWVRELRFIFKFADCARGWPEL